MRKAFLASVVAIQATACAAPGYYVVPSVSVEAVYDDNLFFASEDEQSDFITRVSPALEVGHEGRKLSWSGRAGVDAEAYASESELNSADVRQVAGVDVEYLPTSRLTLNAAAEYTKTETPVDLSIIPGGAIPGLLVGRAEAERTTLSSAASYRMTALTQGTVAFTHANEQLNNVAETDTSIAEAWIDQRLSEVNTLSYGYIHRRYEFDDSSGLLLTNESDQDTDIPWIGLAHQLNERTLISARAGPRLGDDSSDAYVLASLQYRLTDGELRVDYQRDETTLLGVSGNLELEAIYASIRRQFGTQLEVQFTPGYAKVSQAGFSTDIYNVSVGAVYKIDESISLTATYDHNLQEVHPAGGGTNEVSRNVIMVGARFTYPRREPRDPR
jgi:hypothetical protein